MAIQTAGCTTSGGQPAPAPTTGGNNADPLSWFAGSITQVNDPLWTLRDAFERTYPGLSVQIISLPPSTDSMRVTLETILSSGANSPDVFLGDIIWPAEFGNLHYAVPLDMHLGDGFFQRFPQDIVKGSQYGGHIYAAPFYTDQGLLYYRRDILATHGIPPPATWEDLVAAAQRLKAAGETCYQFAWQAAAYEGLTCNWIEYLADRLGPVPDPQAYVDQIDSAAAVDALTFMQELISRGISPQEVTSWQEYESTAAFSSGKAVFLRGWNSSWNAIFPNRTLADRRSTVGVLPLPRFRDTPGDQAASGFSTVGGWSLFVNPRTAQLSSALRLLSWITDVRAQRILAAQGQVVPANQKVRSEPDVNKGAGWAGTPLDTARNARNAVRPANNPHYPDVTRVIYSNVHNCLIGQTTPAQALRTAGAQLRSLVGGKSGPASAAPRT